LAIPAKVASAVLPGSKVKSGGNRALDAIESVLAEAAA